MEKKFKNYPLDNEKINNKEVSKKWQKIQQRKRSRRIQNIKTAAQIYDVSCAGHRLIVCKANPQRHIV